MIYKDRKDAGAKLAERLKEYKESPDVLILGLARGGVVLAAEISRILKLPFDLVMTRKIGAPFNPELALGAISETGKGYFNESLIQALGVSKTYLEETIQTEKKEAARRLTLYRKERPAPSIKGKIVVLVDDGIATGATMMAAALSTQSEGAKKIVVAIPVAPPSSLEFLNPAVDQIICLNPVEDFMAVSQFYEAFHQVEDAEIVTLLH
ncbi:MAG: phosphoribosyltransferase [Simkania sp.]|nr:phosphoribosyltransferase [Simkania sp.]MCB1074621.1 phosphoribosyltransferase [Simkania sp.]MCB1083862.1 phosphoribosyltransferase [Simkania sp.]MCP5490480.1 phosphoribosyltransferase [Chlamydiales bacterium]